MQSLLLQPHSADPFLVLEATGELDLHTQDEFEVEVGRYLGDSSVVVDLSGLDFLAISALRSLIVCHRRADPSGHQLFYAEASPQALRLLSVSGLDAVLPVAASVAQVLGASADLDHVDAVPGAGGLDGPPVGASVGGLVDQPSRDLAQLDVG